MKRSQVIKQKYFFILFYAFLAGCAYYPEKDLTTLRNEELFALENLPCESVGQKSVWDTQQHSFLCSIGSFGEMLYTLYESGPNTGKVNQAKFIWKEYQDSSFFPSKKDKVRIVLSRLSDKFAPNDRNLMMAFMSRLNVYTFYTEYLKIKHTATYYTDTPEPYILHRVSLERLTN